MKCKSALNLLQIGFTLKKKSKKNLNVLTLNRNLFEKKKEMKEKFAIKANASLNLTI